MDRGGQDVPVVGIGQLEACEKRLKTLHAPVVAVCVPTPAEPGKRFVHRSRMVAFAIAFAVPVLQYYSLLLLAVVPRLARLRHRRTDS